LEWRIRRKIPRYKFFETPILGYIGPLSQLDEPNRMSAAPLTLSAHGLMRRFGRHSAVDGVSLQLHRGEVLGLLGQNGAGKSTTLQMLAGILPPHAGRIEICGYDLALQPGMAKARIGFLPETPPLYRDMRVDDYLQYAARLRRMPRPAIPAALESTRLRCGLQDVGKKIIGTLSNGYQQRVGIAQAIIHQPEVVILDEPTVGLDPAQLHDIRKVIRELGNAHSVILSTHLLGEVENICDRVEIMHHGRLVYGNSCAGMKQHGNGQMKLEEVFMQITGHAAAMESP
jgi:gliding motility-associated transport system ATP-binding protein